MFGLLAGCCLSAGWMLAGWLFGCLVAGCPVAGWLTGWPVVWSAFWLAWGKLVEAAKRLFVSKTIVPSLAMILPTLIVNIWTFITFKCRIGNWTKKNFNLIFHIQAKKTSFNFQTSFSDLFTMCVFLS